jgi:hypothetical protein
MATLCSIATGNFTAAGTWAVCDATSENDSNAANTVLTTSYVASSTFTPGAITIDAIAVKVALRVNTTGTMSVELYNSTGAASVAGTEVTINVSDILLGDSAANGGCGWYVFKFSASVTLLAATAYSVRAKTSSSTQVNLFSSATSNWSRQLRTTTTAAPASNDKLIIAGQWTAAATSSSYVVTMDNTATTTFGNISVNNKATLEFGTTAATNYYLKHKLFDGYHGGTLNVGTTGTPMPSTSTAVLEAASTSAAEFGIDAHSGFTWTMQGASKNHKTLLTADEAAAQTVIGPLVSTSGWAVGDELAFPTTTQTSTQCEKKTILTVDSATQVTLSAGLTNAHSGTSPIQCEVANITRNIKIRGVSSTLTGYVRLRTLSVTVDFDYVEFYWLGSGTAGKRGIMVETTSGAVSIRYCSVHDNTATSARGFEVTSTSGSVITISDNVVYLTTSQCFRNEASTGVNTFDGNLFIRSSGADTVSLGDVGCTFTNNKAAGGGFIGIYLNETAGVIGTFSGNTAHGNSSEGIYCFSVLSGTISSNTSWRNTYGIKLEASSNNTAGYKITVDGATLFGNSVTNMSLGGRYWRGQSLIKNCVMNGGVTQVCPTGITLLGGTCADYITFKDCTFGVTTGHTSRDINCGGEDIFNIQFYNCTFASSTTLSQQSGINTLGAFWRGMGSVKHNGVAGAYRNWQGGGTLSDDSTFFNTATPSCRMTPLSPFTSYHVVNLISPTKVIPVASGATIAVSVWVRKSAAGDGTAYTGFQPRLMVRANPAMGYDVDTALDTAAAATGTWEELTGTTSAAPMDGALEFYVDCGATAPWPTTVAGWVNVDDFTTTTTTDPSGMKYAINGSPTLSLGASAVSGGGGGSSYGHS